MNLVCRSMRAYCRGKCPTQKKIRKYLGCNAQFLRDHLESQFEPWMNWDNFGDRGEGRWTIDHIIPLRYKGKADLMGLERLHWSNVKPLSEPENTAKGNRFIG